MTRRAKPTPAGTSAAQTTDELQREDDLDVAASNADVPEGFVSVAALVRAHGLRGELRVKVWNEDSDLLSEVTDVLLRSKDGSFRKAKLVNARAAGDHWLTGLEGISDRDAAEAVRGTEVFVSREDFPELDEDEVYLVDLLGFEVWDGERLVGVVDGFFEYPSVDCLRVTGADGVREVPMLDEFVEDIDREARILRAVRTDELPLEPTKPAR